jgi:hypothetical protein
MAIIHDEHCHVVDRKKTGDSGTMNMGRYIDVGGQSSGHNGGFQTLDSVAEEDWVVMR